MTETTTSLKVTRIPEPEHLGDGLYVAYDGYHIVISVNHHSNKVAFIEPPVYQALQRWVNMYPEFAAVMNGVQADG